MDDNLGWQRARSVCVCDRRTDWKSILRKQNHRPILAQLLCLAVGLIWSPVARADAPPLKLADLTPAASARIDGAALAAPLENLPAQKLDFSGDIVAWLISRAPLRPEEERARAEAAHAETIAKFKPVATPPEAHAVFQKLLATLPGSLKPAVFQYTLTVVDSPDLNAFNAGGGFVYITAPLLRLLLEDPARGRDMLAFVLAHELGHIGLLHSRRGYQAVMLREELEHGVQTGIDNARVQQFLLTTVNPAGSLVRFLYTKWQEYEADLFAIHLCRNAAFRLNKALDFLRLLCLMTETRGVTAVAHQTGAAALPPTLAYYFAAHPDPHLRLKRLYFELTGQLEHGDGYGLFEFNRQTTQLTPVAGNSMPPDQRAIVFIHGMEGDRTSYLRMMNAFTGDQRADGVRLFALGYPNDQSLACSGRFLKNELHRTGITGSQTDFVCHSAGGLVFRFYTEVTGGEFRRAVFHGTPHGGSSLATLRFLLEASELLGGLKLGFPTALKQTIVDGHGQISYDLQPDSLFLRYLARFEKPGIGRYHIVRGRALKLPQALLLQAGVDATRALLKRKIATASRSPLLQRAAVDATDRLVVAREISEGDLAVSLDSADLRGAASLKTMSLNHVELKSDANVFRHTVSALLP